MHNDIAQLKFSNAPADITAINKKIVKPERFTTSSGGGKALFHYLGNRVRLAFFASRHLEKSASARSTG
ncbi:hypothetical protein C2L65_34730 [Paraburkholderia terrae]|uniref:Uncharacterized protein n=1 Tax=Paraburkholderia terrae TaxID=311230 RepID=A0A2I8EZ64_9BURK|nr:hypothetical protein C2L65_34730 [Paraburkholderia terrae]